MSEVHPTNANEVAWTSWLPAVGFALARSTGPVLEIGIGHFSTPFLHEYCKGAGRNLFSVESNAGWLAKFEKLGHDFRYDWKDLSDFRLGVTFIDNSPGGKARLDPFLAFLGRSDFVVVHDYHRENEEAIKPFLDGVNYRVFETYNPPTLLASKFHQVQ